MKAFADKRQGQDGKLEADVGSDEAFLEQAKLRALQALRNVLLGEDNDAAKSNEDLKSFGSCTSGGGEAAHSDSAILEQAELSSGSLANVLSRYWCGCSF